MDPVAFDNHDWRLLPMRARRVARVLAVVVAFLGGLGWLRVAEARRSHGEPHPPQACSVKPMAYTTLRVGGQPVYVNAQAVSLSRGRILLLGVPNYVRTTPMRAARETAPVEVSDSLLGAVLEADGSVAFVASPFPRRAVEPQAVALPDGAWLVVFGEVATPTDEYEYPRQRWRALWGGVHDGRSWTELRRIQVPDGLTPNEGTSFSLSSNGAEAAVALVVSPSDGSMPPDQILLARRRPERWAASVIAVPGPGPYPQPHAVDELSLQPWGDRGFALLVKRDDMSLPPEGAGSGSLFLYAPAPQWQEHRVVAGVDRWSVSEFAASLHEGRAIITWIDDATVVTYSGSTSSPPLNEVVVDSARTRIDSRVTRLSDGSPMWITQHWRSEDLTADLSENLRFFTMQSDSVRLAAELPSPFMWFQAATSDQNTVTLVGATPEIVGRDTIVGTGIMQVRVDCRTPR